MLTFGELVVVDPRTLRPVVGVAQVTDAHTGEPLDTFNAAGDPAQVVSSARGYVGQFHTADDHPLVRLTFPEGDPVVVTAREALTDAAAVVDTITGGRLSPESLSATFATHERLTEVATGQSASLTDSAVAGAITSGSSSSAAVKASAAAEVDYRLPQQVPPLVAAQAGSVVPPLVAQAMASDPAVAQAAAAAVPPAVDDYISRIGVGWTKGDIATGTDLNTLTTPGVYRVPSYAVATSLVNAPPEPNAGTIEVLPFGGQRYIFGNGWDEPRQVERAGTTGPWVAMTRLSEPLLTGTNLDNVRTPGTYSEDNSTVAQTFTGMPAAVRGQPFALEVVRKSINATQHRVVQELTVFAFAVGQPPRKFIRQLDHALTGEWAEVITDKPMAPLGHRRDMLLQASRLRRGGRIGTAGATPVGLSFDHGFAKFRDLLLPELRRLGLPCTVAVCVDDLGVGQNAGVSYPQLQDWAINYGIEIANHGRSHADQTIQTTLRNAILNNSLDLLRANLPKLVVDSFIMPGVTTPDSWMGFDHGSRYASWWEHIAGRYILDHHAVATSILPGRAFPQTGQPVQTMTRMGVDTATWANTVQSLIPTLHGTGMGVQIYNHPDLIDTTDRITLARLVQLLEFLAAERDAGRVEVLTVSGYAWSDPDSTMRADLAKLNGGFTNGVCTLNLATLTPWARTGQWIAEAEGSGNVSVEVADNTGALSAWRTAPDRSRVVFTIPADASTVTVTIPAGATGRVRAV